jgi:hypothetical protein
MEHILSKDVEVSGYRYKITHPMVETAWEIGVELTQLVAEPAAMMASGGKDKSSESLGVAVRSLLGKIEPKKSMALVKKILSSVEVQGLVDGENKKFRLDEAGLKTHFYGRTGAMITLAGETIAFTHEDFFQAIMDGIAKMMPEDKQ